MRNCAERDFDREPGAVPALSEQIGIGVAGGPFGARGPPRFAAARHPERVGDEDVHPLPDQFAVGIAELVLDLLVGEDDPAVAVGEHDAAGHQLEGSAEQALGVGTAVAGPTEWTVRPFRSFAARVVPENGRCRYRAPGNSR